MATTTKTLQKHKLPDLSADVNKFLKHSNDLGSYCMQEEILLDFTKKYPGHDIYEAVEIKAKLLNMFYSTGIQAIDAMVKNIMSIIDIDKILQEPKYNRGLIDAIAELKLKDDKMRNNYSFATKYCALHQPEKYPIYDSIVAAILTKLMKTDQLPPFKLKRKTSDSSSDTYMTQSEFETMLRNYDFFVKVYDIFMADYGLKGKFSYRIVDWYLWGSYKNGNIETEIEKLTQLDRNKYVPYSPKEVIKTKNIYIL